jgi:2'-5' RNA ligase
VTRAFVAIKPPEPVLDAVARVPVPANARPTTREQWHITLQFLGDAVDIDAVGAALQGLMTPAGELQLAGAGPLGNPRKATVFSIDVVGDWLPALAEEIGARLAPIGFPPEERAFRPHLTLARTRRPGGLPTVPGPTGDPWLADQVILYESRLGNGPAQHIEQAVFSLPGNA